MIEVIKKLEKLIDQGLAYLSVASELEMSFKKSPEKWSKKEILGHLIDSGINNLQRFTEVQFENKPYKIRAYKQDDLVITNNYQNAETKELVQFWSSINNRILSLLRTQTEKTLNYQIELTNGQHSDVKFLITDYVTHLEHHLKQIEE